MQKVEGVCRVSNHMSLSPFADYIGGHDETDTLPGYPGPVYFSEECLFPGLLDLLYLQTGQARKAGEILQIPGAVA